MIRTLQSTDTSKTIITRSRCRRRAHRLSSWSRLQKHHRSVSQPSAESLALELVNAIGLARAKAELGIDRKHGRILRRNVSARFNYFGMGFANLLEN
jgi:hypothetical protein